MAIANWEQVVYEKRLQRERTIAEFKTILGPECIAAAATNDIDDIEILVSKISKGDLTSEEVTRACIARYLSARLCPHDCSLTVNLEPSKPTRRRVLNNSIRNDFQRSLKETD